MPDPAPAQTAATQPAAPAAPEGGTADAGLHIEQGFVGSSLNTSRAQRIQQAMNAAVAEVGQVSPEQRAAEMAGEQPRHEKPAEATEEEPEAAAPAEKPAKAKTKAKEEPEAEPAAPAEAIPGVRELIHERKKLRESFQRKEQQLAQQYQQREQIIQQHAQRLQPAFELVEALNSGDLDGAAAIVAKFPGFEGVKGWNDLQGIATTTMGNPLAKEVRALKEQQRIRDEQLRRQQEQLQQQQQQQARAQQEQQWVASIADDLTSDEDPAVSEIVDLDPQFAQHVYGTQRAHHGESGEILPAREAAEKVLAPLWKNVSAWNAFFTKHAASPFIQKITGVRPAPSKKAEKGTASPNGESGTTDRNGVRQRAAKPPPAVSQNRTAEASAQGPMSGAALKRMWAERMNAATNRANTGETMPD